MDILPNREQTHIMQPSKRKNQHRAKARKVTPGKSIPRRILVPIDFSKTSLEALTYALEYAAQFGAALLLIHVVEPAPFVADLRNVPLALSDREMAENAESRLSAVASSERGLSAPIRRMVRIGKAFKVIIDVAKHQKVDLIILSTHGYTGLKHMLLGSTAERVVRHAHCPVLVVRGRKRSN